MYLQEFIYSILQVFEGWLQWTAMGGFKDKHFTTLALAFIKKLAANLKDKDKVLLLIVLHCFLHCRLTHASASCHICVAVLSLANYVLRSDELLNLNRALAALRELQVLLLAVPPVIASYPSRPAAQTELLQQLSSQVAGFSLMTYDYATGDVAPNSPIHWQEENVRELIQQDSNDEGSKGMSATGMLAGDHHLMICMCVCYKASAGHCK